MRTVCHPLLLAVVVLARAAVAQQLSCTFLGEKVVLPQAKGFVASCNFGTPLSDLARCMVGNASSVPIVESLFGDLENFTLSVEDSKGQCLSPAGCAPTDGPCVGGCTSWDDAFCYPVPAGQWDFYSLYLYCGNTARSCRFRYQFRMNGYCGDAQCSSLENCLTCPEDCGACPVMPTVIGRERRGLGEISAGAPVSWRPWAGLLCLLAVLLLA